MSVPTEEPGLAAPSASPAERSGLLADVAIVLAWFVVLGVVAAVVWWQVTPLAAYTRTSDNAVMDAQEFGKQVDADAWYVVIAVVAGLVSGLVLARWRERDPLLTVALVGVGALVASFLMLRLGLWLGPAKPTRSVIEHVAVGHKVPLQLRPGSHVVFLAWPVAAMAGCLLVLLGRTPHRREQDLR